MPRHVRITQFRFEELNDKAKERARDDYRAGYSDDWTGGEILASIKAIVATFGKLKDYRFGCYDRGANVRVSIRDEWDSEEMDEDGYAKPEPFSLAVFSRLMAEEGYAIKPDGKPLTDGQCKFTGVCWDDDIVEAIADALASMDSDENPDNVVGRAICAKACAICEDQYEYATSEEGIEESAAFNDVWFLESGERA